MATLERIRKRAGVLLVVIVGMALFAFVIDPQTLAMWLSSGKQQFNVAEINGEPVSYKEFSQKLAEAEKVIMLQSQQESLDAQTREQIRENVWRNLQREYIMQPNYKDLGLDVSSEELTELVIGDNPHAISRQLFVNPETGVFDRNVAINFISQLKDNPDHPYADLWLYYEDLIRKERQYEKYLSLVSKGLIVTDKGAELNLKNKSKSVDMEFILKPYSSIADSLVEVSSSEIRSYYNEHKSSYEQPESRDIEYVTFTVEPTEEDRRQTLNWVSDIKSDLKNAENPLQFAQRNTDVPVDGAYRSPESFTGELGEFIQDLDTNEVYGPYLEGESYRLTRIASVRNMPDSVKARHILIQDQNVQRAGEIADSLKNVIESGSASFGDVARANSADQGSAINGGDLGWFGPGQMVPEFEQASFFNDEGDIVIVNSQFGVHIIEILDQSRKTRKAQVATLVRNITPGSNTYQQKYSEASQFASTYNDYDELQDSLTSNPQLNSMVKKGSNITSDQRFIGSLRNPREIIRWAYNVETEEGDISPIIELDDMFVVAFLTDIKEEGIASLEQVSDEIKRKLINEKKAALIREDIAKAQEGSQSFTSMAQKLDVDIQNADEISFDSFSIPGGGFEPKVIATAVKMDADTTSEPIEGTRGVYVLRVISVIETEPETDLVAEKSSIESALQQRVNFEVFEALREDADVEDNRVFFF